MSVIGDQRIALAQARHLRAEPQPGKPGPATAAWRREVEKLHRSEGFTHTELRVAAAWFAEQHPLWRVPSLMRAAAGHARRDDTSLMEAVVSLSQTLREAGCA